EFLTGMFRSIDPEVAKLREITVREVLDGAGRTIGNSFPHEPLVELPVRRTIGYLYEGVGRTDLALPHAEAELQLAQAIYGTKDHPDISLGLSHVAECLKTLGRDTEALSKAEACLEMSRRIFKGDNPDEAICLDVNAACLKNLGRSVEALPKYEAAYEMMQRIYQGNPYKGDHADVATCLNHVAECLDCLDRSAEALPKAEASFAMRRRVYKGDHVNVIRSLQTLADCLDALGRPIEAIAKHREALTVIQRMLVDQPSNPQL